MGFAAGREPLDQLPAAYTAGITAPAARAGVVPAGVAGPHQDLLAWQQPGQGNNSGEGKEGSKGSKGDKSAQAIPPISSFTSLAAIWKRYDQGDPMSGMQAWKVLEESGSKQKTWRKGQRRAWSDICIFVQVVMKRVVDGSNRGHASAAAEVAKMDAERAAGGLTVSQYFRKLVRGASKSGVQQQQDDGGSGGD